METSMHGYPALYIPVTHFAVFVENLCLIAHLKVSHQPPLSSSFKFVCCGCCVSLQNVFFVKLLLKMAIM